jgi:hypothetical protein
MPIRRGLTSLWPQPEPQTTAPLCLAECPKAVCQFARPSWLRPLVRSLTWRNEQRLIASTVHLRPQRCNFFRSRPKGHLQSASRRIYCIGHSRFPIVSGPHRPSIFSDVFSAGVGVANMARDARRPDWRQRFAQATAEASNTPQKSRNQNHENRDGRQKLKPVSRTSPVPPLFPPPKQLGSPMRKKDRDKNLTHI